MDDSRSDSGPDPASRPHSAPPTDPADAVEPAADADDAAVRADDAAVRAANARRSPVRAARRRGWLTTLVPVAGVFRAADPAQRRNGLRRDLVAGLTVGALALPSGMAFAELAGLPPVAGLYTLLLPSVLYCLLGSSRQLIVGPEGTTAALTAVALAPLAAGDPERATALAGTLALLVGIVYLVAWVLRLGWVADYFSRPVLVGYLSGVSATLIAGQLDDLTGAVASGPSPVAQLWAFVTNIASAKPLTTAVGVSALGLLLLGKRFAPKLPTPLFVVILGVVVSAAAGLAAAGVATVGTIPPGLPVPVLPSLRPSDLAALAPAAVGIFFAGFGDLILTARSFAGRHAQNVRAGQELLAVGVGNVAAGLTGGMVTNASGSRTAVNDANGNFSQVAGLVGAGFIAVVLLVLTAPMANLPKAVLGAVIIAAAVGLIEPAEWRAVAQASKRELAIALVTLGAVLTVGVLQALILAVICSLIDVIARASRPHDAVLGYVPRLDRWADVAVHAGARVVPGVVVYRLDDRLFFANAEYVKGRVREAIDAAPESPYALVLAAESVGDVDSSGAAALCELADELGRVGIRLYVARARAGVLDALATAGLLERLSPGSVHPTVGLAVRSAVAAGAPAATDASDRP